MSTLDPVRHQAVLFNLDGVLTATATVHAAAWRQLFDTYPATAGVRVFADVVKLLESLREHDVRTAVITASRNCVSVLERAGLSALTDVRVDGVIADELGLAGKPDPAMLCEATRRLGVTPSVSVLVEDSPAGVEAGRRGGFALVIGVDRAGRPDRLRRAGADAVITELTEITISPDPPGGAARRLSEIPGALTCWDELAARLRDHRLVVLCDFDGTLAPIERDPATVQLPAASREALRGLAARCPTGVLSGRDLRDVRRRVGLDGMWYAGSHGFELVGPQGEVSVHEDGESALPDLDRAEGQLAGEFEGVPGVLVDRKRFALAVHYRNAEPGAVGSVQAAVRQVADRLPNLKLTYGRMVSELVPDVDWNKGRALLWLLDHLRQSEPDEAGSVEVVPLYAGDDFTDEDALRVVRDRGVGIVVRSSEHGDRRTWACYAVDGPTTLTALLVRLASLPPAGHSTRAGNVIG